MQATDGPRQARVYNRVSEAGKNGRSKSTAEQNAENLAACRELGWEPEAVYTEPEGISASRFTTKAREVWERLRREMRTGEAVIVWETSRSSRRMGPWVDLLDACRELGVLIHVTSHEHTYDPRRWRDRKALLEDGIAAEAGSEETSLRITRHSRVKAAAGLPHGRILYGYRREYDPGTGEFVRQVEDEAEAAVVREVFARFAAGDGLHKIAVDFTRRGVPVAYRRDPAKRAHPGVPPQWDMTRLRQMIANPGYIARRVYRGEVIGAACWPALADEETFWICAKRLADPARRRNRGEVLDKHLLSGVALCGQCGGFLRKLPNNRYRLQYACRGRGGDITSGRMCVAIVADVFEEYVSAQVTARLSRPDAARLFSADRSAEIAGISARILARQAELGELRAAVKDGRLSVASLVAIEPALLAGIEELDRQIPALLPEALQDVTGPDAAARWDALPLDRKKAVMTAIMDIRLHKAEGARGRSGRIDARWAAGDRLAQVAARTAITWKTQ